MQGNVPAIGLPLVNTQPAEHRTQRDDGALDVVDVFETIQGEGPFAGRPSVFVRLAGCNLTCPACDTDYTSNRRQLQVSELLKTVQACRPRGLVVITGGESFRQGCGRAVEMLSRAGYYVQFETNGTLFDDTMTPWLRQVSVVCCPKTGGVNQDLLPYIGYWKYVISAGQVDPNDGLPTSSLNFGVRPARPPKSFPSNLVYVQPCDERDQVRNRVNTQTAITSCLKYGYTLCLQVHKIVGLP